MKLVIQIPCLNEAEHLPSALADLPRELPGVDEIEVLVIDDGSTDGTTEVAFAHGVHHVVRFTENRGLSAAYAAGLDAALRLGADVIVNTDADNQYVGADVATIAAPVVAGRADLVVGDRQTDKISHFSPLKRLLQRWGSSVVRRASATEVADATSGFRAISRRLALRTFIHNRFSYTLEALIQAGRAGFVVGSVPVRTNPQTRPSRLFRGIPDYLKRNGPVILRAYLMYRPVQSFAALASGLFAFGAIFVLRFLYFYVKNPSYSGYVQSLTLGVGAIILAFMVALVALLSDLLAANRRLAEAQLVLLREAAAVRGDRRGIESRGALAWRSGARS